MRKITKEGKINQEIKSLEDKARKLEKKRGQNQNRLHKINNRLQRLREYRQSQCTHLRKRSAPEKYGFCGLGSTVEPAFDECLDCGANLGEPAEIRAAREEKEYEAGKRYLDRQHESFLALIDRCNRNWRKTEK